MSQGASPTSSHPAVGTLIDDGALELVEVLGVGGYGVVYRAIDTVPSSWRSYAVKCLTSMHAQSSARRHLNIREITLHQIASAHPAIVTLHRVVEDHGHTFIIMDYAPDSDLFTQILLQCRYLGDDVLIKHVFLQILDAVLYCHSWGIYHRDLKPENVLCFDHGYRVAITDFGLATTEKSSAEFRTGSVYHMSPECQAGDSTPTSSYSPMYNDIWSLGIILLNLTTGRNPWKSATSDDTTYQAYLKDPNNFLPSVLPISEELNDILVQILETDLTARMSLIDFRDAIESISTFYSDNVIFEGSLAKCPWEAGVDLGNGTVDRPLTEKRSIPPIPEVAGSYWAVPANTSLKSQAPMDMSVRPCWQGYSDPVSCSVRKVYDYESGTPYESSTRSSCSSDVSTPATPCSLNQDDHDFSRVKLNVDATYARQHHYHAKTSSFTSLQESSWEENDEEHLFTSSFTTTTAKVDADTTPINGFRKRKRLSMPNPPVYAEPPGPLVSRFSSDSDSISPVTSCQMTFDEPNEDILAFSDVPASRGGSKPIDIVGERRHGDNTRTPYTFNPLRFFPRSSGSSWLTPKSSPMMRHPLALYHIGSPSVPPIPWEESPPSRSVAHAA
ncbi:kinase-like protein [Phlegmacium glaucopus]|nr:kinase-like protein [Phlegmacium glaucopus]